MTIISRVILKKGKEVSVKRYHPWIFSGALKAIQGNPGDGDLVEVYSSENDYLATGHYHKSSISVRILTFSQSPVDDAFWKNKLQTILKYRMDHILPRLMDTNVFRLIHGEGDGIPGLIVDYYNGVAVMQAHSSGIYKIRRELANLLMQLFDGKLQAVYDKSEATASIPVSLKEKDGYLTGTFNGPMEVMEYGNRFLIDWQEGQKTGFFIDQRENRKLLGDFCKGQNVANIFGYTGGFSVYALKQGARAVTTLDSSKKAIEMAQANVLLNFGENVHHQVVCEDAFSFLASMPNNYNVIILDPPAFAKHNDALHNALQAYKRINQKAFEKIVPGGIVFTFSCSQAVTKENFRKSVFAAAANSGRHVRILYQLTQPADHPVSIYHPEGEYLKGLVLHVE